MQRKEFVPGVVFRLPKSNGIFKYEIEHKIDCIKEIGYGDHLFEHQRGLSLNLSIGNRSIYFYSGFGHSCFLMNSDKFKYEDLQLVSLDSLIQPAIQNGNSNGSI